jgi:hypothetical protein
MIVRYNTNCLTTLLSKESSLAKVLPVEESSKEKPLHGVSENLTTREAS